MRWKQGFDELFPKSIHKFSLEVPLFRRRGRGDMDDHQWFAMLSADLLLTRASSHREKTDLFTNSTFWRSFRLFQEENAIMAKRKVTQERPQNDRAEWVGFLDRRLSDDELAALDESKPKPSELWTAIDDIIADGYRFILSYNKRTKLASVTLVDDNPDRKTGGYALSSSDTDGAGALKMAVFKHVVLLERDWSSLLDQPTKVRRG